MSNAEEFSGRRSRLGRMLPTYRGPGSAASSRARADRVRYAPGGAPPRVEPLCTAPPYRMAPQRPADHQGGDPGELNAAGTLGRAGDPSGLAGGPGGLAGDPSGLADGPGGLASGPSGSEMDGGPWLTGAPVGGPNADRWVLVCGGIAAAAAFAAAFVASGGVASHPAVPAARMPAVISQACPSPAAHPTP